LNKEFFKNRNRLLNHMKRFSTRFVIALVAVAANISFGQILKSVSKHNVTCNGGNNGWIKLNMATLGPFEFKLNGGSVVTDSLFTGLIGLPVGNTYKVEYKETSSSIWSVEYVALTEPKQITITFPGISLKNVTCFNGNDGEVVASANGDYTGFSYKWNTTPALTTAKISGLKSGSYSVTATDDSGCFGTNSIIISQPTDITYTLSMSQISCNGKTDGSVTLKNVSGGTGTISYTWTGGPSGWSSPGNVDNITSLAAGKYDYEIKDGNGCTKTGSATIVEPSKLAITETVVNTLCYNGNDGSISVDMKNTGTAPYQYTWTGPSGWSSPGSSVDNITNLKAGDYTVNVLDSRSCPESKTIKVTEPNQIQISGSITDVLCNGDNDGAIDVTPSGGTAAVKYSYLWDDFFKSTSEDLSNLTAGDYSITVTDDNGCSETKKFTIAEPTALSINETHTDNVCYGESLGTIDVTVSGGVLPALGYTYDWTSNTNPVASTEDITGLAADIYDLKVTDDNGCNALISISIKQPTQIQVAANITDAKCYASNEGEIALSLSGGTIAAGNDYKVDWTGPGGFISGDRDIIKLYAGDYNYTISDDEVCKVTGTLTVGEPTDLKSNITSNSVCDGDGTLTFEGVDGTPGLPPTPYTYEVDDKPAVSPLSNLFDKIYEVKVIDANGCMDSVDVDLKHNDPFKPMVKTKMKVVYLNATGQASIVISDIDNGSTDNCGIKSSVLDKIDFTCSDVGQNIVTLTVTDINDNVKSDTASVFVRDTISPTITVQSTVIPIDTSGFAYLTQNLVVVSSSDNCSVGSIVLSKSIFGLADVGNNAVDITITDASGNVVKKTVNVNVYIADSDKDSIPDYIEKNWDSDGDGIMNYQDLDSDNDAIADLIENNSQKSYASQDKDADGIPNALDLDSDDDGINDVTEVDLNILDTDGDGQKDNATLLIGVPNDQDSDGTPDYLDLDSDGDGINDLIESLKNHTDANNDGMVDGADLDKDGLKDFADGSNKWPDANDKHPGNSDTDAVEDWRDTDSDDDGITDQIEGNIDTDSDGTPNYRDIDSDGDGISDKTETAADFDGDSKGNYIDTDSDGDGIDDQTEGTSDPDNDNAGNWLDTDSDGDGINDQTESTGDPDGDSVGNWLDTDSDGDGINDQLEGTGDPDGDMIGNWLDLDSDADGISDKNETSDDYDGDGTGNWLDLDSDDDELLDAAEGETDADNNGKRDFVDAQYIIPEGFSPNGDGANDILYISGLKVYKESQLVVINQWGQIVFDSGPGYSNNWDGSYGGTGMQFGSGTVPEGIYYFVFKPNKFNLPNISGNIYIKP